MQTQAQQGLNHTYVFVIAHIHYVTKLSMAQWAYLTNVCSIIGVLRITSIAATFIFYEGNSR